MMYTVHMLISYVCGAQSSLIPVIDPHVTGRYRTLRDVTGRYGTLRDVTGSGQYEELIVLCIIRIRIVLCINTYYVLSYPDYIRLIGSYCCVHCHTTVVAPPTRDFGLLEL